MNPSQKKFDSMVKTHSHRTLFFVLGLVVVGAFLFFLNYFSNMKNSADTSHEQIVNKNSTQVLTDQDKAKLLEANAVKNTISDSQKIKLLENSVKASKNQPKLTREQISALLNKNSN